MPLQSRTLPAARGRRSIDIPDSRRKSNRENIEAELVCLRTRKFVRQESDRISPRAASEDEVSGPFQDHRRCTRRGMVGSIREAARKAKVFEMRLIGRRSFWPTTTDDGGNLCTERIERPLPPAHGANRRVFLFWQHREDLGDAKRVATNLRKRKKHGKSTPPNEYKSKQLLEKRHPLQFWRPRGSQIALLSADEKNDNRPKQRRQGRHPLQFWRPREAQNVILPTDEGEDETVVVSPSLDVDIDIDTHEANENKGEDKKKKKKNIPLIAAAIGGVATSTIGVVVAVILL